MFKKITKSVWSLLVSVGEARYAADLARNRKYEEAKAAIQGK